MEQVSELLEDALVFLQAGEYKQAEEGYAQALQYAVDHFGENSSVSARCLGHLSRCCYQQKKLDIAGPMYERLIRTYEGLGGEDEGHRGSMEHVDAILQLAIIYREQERHADAKELTELADKMTVEAKEKMEAEEDESEESSDEEEAESSEEDSKGKADAEAKGRTSSGEQTRSRTTGAPFKV
mmetsp:Transcript_29465/g.37962  ORF Transcript_29465/g.37962 Transcript_29465/m.37962 type:complete len:183 (+) Transcript_29465:110-658(+)